MTSETLTAATEHTGDQGLLARIRDAAIEQFDQHGTVIGLKCRARRWPYGLCFPQFILDASSEVVILKTLPVYLVDRDREPTHRLVEIRWRFAARGVARMRVVAVVGHMTTVGHPPTDRGCRAVCCGRGRRRTTISGRSTSTLGSSR